MSGQAEEYLLRAAECQQMVKMPDLASAKEGRLKLAASWYQLFESALRQERPDLIIRL